MNRFAYIVIFVLLGVFILACDEQDTVSPVVSNKWRAKEIKGHNALWGDFTLSLSYISDVVSLGIVRNSQNDTIATLADGTVTMKVPALSQEEIDALPSGAKIPMTNSIIYSIDRETLQESITYYKRDGLSFIYDYEENYLFEYDDTLAANPKILKWRKVGDGESDMLMERMVYVYDDNHIVRGELAIYERDWKVVSNWNYIYADERLIELRAVSVGGEELLRKTFSYEGDNIEVATVEDGETKNVVYTMNADGFVTRIDEGNGNYMEIEYELGNGNFSSFTPQIVRLYGEPYIK